MLCAHQVTILPDTAIKCGQRIATAAVRTQNQYLLASVLGVGLDDLLNLILELANKVLAGLKQEMGDEIARLVHRLLDLALHMEFGETTTRRMSACACPIARDRFDRE